MIFLEAVSYLLGLYLLFVVLGFGRLPLDFTKWVFSFGLMEIYSLGAVVVGLIVFIGAWIYCIFTYGYLLGVGLGWIPAAITAAFAALLWPLILVGVVVIALMSYA